MTKTKTRVALIWPSLLILAMGFISTCKSEIITVPMKEKQISITHKMHSLDNNDNFSPNDKFLCYDTRGTVFNQDIANCKSIEKIELATGSEIVLYEPESVTGEQGAPGVGAASWHPSENKVIFMHGPLLNEVKARGYYGIRNRTGVEVSTDGLGKITKVDMRDIAPDRPTTSGAQRGSTHRHEYTQDGNRIGFTYDDYLMQNYDRTIGYMEVNDAVPEGYTHYFSVLLKPAEKGKSKAGEIERAYGDSWVDPTGSMRAFIGKVRTKNGVDYSTDLFVADIPDGTDITTAHSGDKVHFPEPPAGIKIRRLTHSGNVEGIVRGSFNGKNIGYLSKDENGFMQVFIINSQGSDLSLDNSKQPKQLSTFSTNASALRWHPKKNWVFAIVDGNIAALCAEPGNQFGKAVMLTDDQQIRSELVVSHHGNSLAYNIQKKQGKDNVNFKQIFILELDWDQINRAIQL
jgi:hypothetical protein